MRSDASDKHVPPERSPKLSELLEVWFEAREVLTPSPDYTSKSLGNVILIEWLSHAHGGV